MTRRKSSRFEEAAGEIDLRLGDLLGQLGDVLSEAAGRLSEGESGEIRREHQFDTGKGPIRASAGIRIRTLGETLEARAQSGRRPDTPVNSSKQTRPKPKQTQASEPKRVDATVFEEPGVWSLVADIPGVSTEHVSLERTGLDLCITAQNAQRHYLIETALPDGWAKARLTHQVQNGILEVTAQPDEDA